MSKLAFLKLDSTNCSGRCNLKTVLEKSDIFNRRHFLRLTLGIIGRDNLKYILVFILIYIYIV